MTQGTMIDDPKKPERIMHVMALNSGSSSLKFGLYRVGADCIDALIAGEVEAIGEKASAFHAKDAQALLRGCSLRIACVECAIRISRS